MGICQTTLYGELSDAAVEVWSDNWRGEYFWLVYMDDSENEDRIDLSREQLRELADAIDSLLA